MMLKLIIKDKKVSLRLEKDGKPVAAAVVTEERQLSEKLLPTIDKLLKQHKLKPADIRQMRLESDIGENFTTYRIAKATVDAWNYATAKQI